MFIKLINNILSSKKNNESEKNNISARPVLGENGLHSSVLGLYRQGKFEGAKASVDAILKLDPSNTEALLVSGLLYLDEGYSQKALDVLMSAVKLFPKNSDIQLAFGRACVATGKIVSAMSAFKLAIVLDPHNGDAPFYLSLLEISKGRLGEAERLLNDSIINDPNHADAHFHLGNIKFNNGDLIGSIGCYRRAVEIRPKFTDSISGLGRALIRSGNVLDGASYLSEALNLNPDLAQAAYELAIVRVNQRRWSDAVNLLRASISVDSQQPHAQYWLGNALTGLGDVVQAREAFRAAISLDIKFTKARWCQAMVQLSVIPMSTAEQFSGSDNFSIEIDKLAKWCRNHKLGNHYEAVGCQQPFYLAYVPQNHNRSLAQYGSLCSTVMNEWVRRENLPYPRVGRAGAFRVGIVSSHMNNHSVWHALTRGWIEHLDVKQFELHLLHTGSVQDSETAWARKRVAQVHEKLGDWKEWAKFIADQRFDVLLYPDIGMDDATCIRLASLRLASTQISSWGHPITTGLPTIDYFLSAEAFEPADAESHYSERLIYLPRLGCCYQKYETKGKVVPLSEFGIGAYEKILICAGTPFKYSPRDDCVLVDIARRCAPCKLIFFRYEPSAISDMLERRLRIAFDSAGLLFDEHVCFIPWLSQELFFGLLKRADVYLDTIEFSGFNTTMQAVECSTPIVAWEGAYMRGRFASSILRQAGLGEWVANTHNTYAELVEGFCKDRTQRDKYLLILKTNGAGLFNDRETVLEFSRLLYRLIFKGASH